MANDIVLLLDHLSVTEPVHMVGHDIGGMIAYVFATRHAERTASLIWGECPLPGTKAHEEDRTIHGSLVEIYLSHFFDKVSYNRSAISQADLEYYAPMYSRPGALRCAFGVYRALLTDADENQAWIKKHGKCKVRSLGLSGGNWRHRFAAPDMFEEVHEDGTIEVKELPESGHYVAEENSEGFSQVVLGFIDA
ncbi:hypothetical protein CGCVW01_v007982 [Colletotrichum viniferum]|nr:hypothetical protein CGCVW01_v007982 [Colletotrichum viniferum]